MKDFKQFFTESKSIDNLINWANKNPKVAHVFKSKGYADQIKKAAFGDKGIIGTLVPYTYYAVPGVSESEEPLVFVEIEKDNNHFLTIVIRGGSMRKLMTLLHNL